MSRDCVALHRGVMGLSAVCDFVVFPDHTGLLFLFMNVDILKDAKSKRTSNIMPNTRVFIIVLSIL